MLTNKRTISVEFGECDPSGIVYNPNYFIWFDLSVHALLARGGLSLKTLMAEFGIDGIPVVDYKCKFLSPGALGRRTRDRDQRHRAAPLRLRHAAPRLQRRRARRRLRGNAGVHGTRRATGPRQGVPAARQTGRGVFRKEALNSAHSRESGNPELPSQISRLLPWVPAFAGTSGIVLRNRAGFAQLASCAPEMPSRRSSTASVCWPSCGAGVEGVAPMSDILIGLPGSRTLPTSG